MPHDYVTIDHFFMRNGEMSFEISYYFCSKIVIATNFIKNCSKQGPDKDKIATILNSANSLATDETLENCGIIPLKHYESGPPSYVIVDQDSLKLKGDFSQDENMKKRCATVGIQDEALPQFNGRPCSHRNTNKLGGNIVGNDKVCYHSKLPSVSKCELDTSNSQNDSFLCILDGVNTLSKAKEYSSFVSKVSHLCLA